MQSALTIRLMTIDWCSTNNSTVCAVRVISVPTLVLAHQGHYFIRDGEEIFENAAAIDKEFIVVEGATHGGGNCNECAAYHSPGPYERAAQYVELCRQLGQRTILAIV